MNSGKGKNDSDNSNGRALKIRVTAVSVLEELGQLRSAGSVEQETLDVVQRRRDGLFRLLIKIRRGEAGYAAVKRFLDGNEGLPSEIEA